MRVLMKMETEYNPKGEKMIIQQEKQYNVCVIDLPVGGKISIVLSNGLILLNQVIIKNYGSSLLLQDDYQVQIVSNGDIRSVITKDKSTIERIIEKNGV